MYSEAGAIPQQEKAGANHLTELAEAITLLKSTLMPPRVEVSNAVPGADRCRWGSGEEHDGHGAWKLLFSMNLRHAVVLIAK